MLWLFTGDSITQGAAHTGEARSYPQIFEEWIRYEMGRSHDFVVNTAISGSYAEDLVADFDERVARFRPDAVAVMLGTNDAVRGPSGLGTYRDSLRTIVERAAQGGARPIVLTPPRVTVAAATRAPHIAGYAQAARDVAAEQNASLVDIFAGWSQGEGEFPTTWMDDAFHPNARGHREIARLLVAHVAAAID